MKKRSLMLLSITFIAGLLSCNKNNSDAPVVSLYAKLNVVNASADTVDFYRNGTRLNNTSSIFPSAATGYYNNVFAGQQTYQIKKTFNQTSNTAQSLFSIPLKLDTGINTYYSLFIAGETGLLAFLTTDTLLADTITNTCYVRFVNASPDAGNLDFVVGDKTFTNQAFKTASSFVLVTVGSTSTPISVYHTGSTTPIISGSYNLESPKSYTFFSEGKLTGSGSNAFGISAMINVN